ncbi:hypothetical protein Q4555_14960 [Octadecabacter sp. 1_MG-2023]|uniref:Flp family type IVb pilin n=1 Tax=unclassified Octadecabacter TaxID=196158 RepID=UPI001C09ED20|nr:MULTISPECIES: hypothetical protein [unclassified Octadecabacter]MBU2992003.1 hypothetical protein [Octadecabacter sp. B2R22]MDO6735977.1 hypothetical protein [Octadecabacter sp. 1_MG-2023]
MFNFIKTFRKEEEGAVTVDWVVLTAAIVGLGIAVITTVGRGATDQATGLAGTMSAVSTIDFNS